MQKSDGMNYAPEGKPAPVVKPGEFVFAAAALDHGHIYGQCKGLTEAGGELRYVFDPDPAKVEKFRGVFPDAQPLPSLDAVLEKAEIHLVAAAAVPSERGPLGCRVMDAGKDYFTDKTPFTTLAQLETARAKVAATQRKYAVYFSERLHVECAVRAGQLIEQGAIGRVVNVIGLGPHRSSPASRLAMRDTVPGTASHDTRRPSATGSVSVRAEPAEHSSLASASVSLTLVAQALHWFDLDAFYREVHRVSRPGAAIVGMTYDLPRVSARVDGVIDDLYGFLDGYWPQGREHVENRYADIPFDFTRLPAPDILMSAAWTAESLLGFLRSWSAVANYERATGIDIVKRWTRPILDAWGGESHSRGVSWPLTILAGRVSGAV